MRRGGKTAKRPGDVKVEVDKDTGMKKRAGWDRGRSHGHLPSGQLRIIGFVGRVVLLREDTDG